MARRMSFGSEVCCEQWAFWLGVVGFQYDPWGPSKLDKEHTHTHESGRRFC